MDIFAGALRPLTITVNLEKDERFDVNYRGWANSKENNISLVVDQIRFSIDLPTGNTSLLARGFLRNADGEPGRRRREQTIKTAQSPWKARAAVVSKWAEAIDSIERVLNFGE